jgi:CRISPR-associated protein Cas5h
MNEKQVMSFRLEGLYFVCFRQPASTSTVLTYPVPPFTALRGLIANCLGRVRRVINGNVLVDDLDLQTEIKIGIELLRRGSKNRELAKLLKFMPKDLKPAERKHLEEQYGHSTYYERDFPSSPIFKEFLVQPAFQIYLIGNADMIQEIHTKLSDPERPIYLGQSDDLADIYDLTPPQSVEEVEAEVCHTIFEGIGEGCELLKLPYAFDEQGNTLRYAGQSPHVLSLPFELKPAKLPQPMKVYKVNERYVAAY